MNKTLNKILKMLVVAGLVVMATGCAALNQKEAQASYSNGNIMYAIMNNANAKFGLDAVKFIESYGANVCDEVKYCGREQSSLVLHNGNVRSSMSKILKVSVLTTKDVNVKKTILSKPIVMEVGKATYVRLLKSQMPMIVNGMVRVLCVNLGGIIGKICRKLCNNIWISRLPLFALVKKALQVR